MADTLTLPPPETPAANAAAEGVSLVLGAAITLALFLGVAHFEATEPPAEEADLAELRAMAVPMETPPPRPVETAPVEVAASPFAGLDIAASDSPVRIAVVPPDLSTLLPSTTTAPAAKIEPAQLHTEFKPRTEIGGDFSRIFQQHEVDQRPSVLSRPKPYVPPVVRGNAKSLRITVLMVISEQGAVTSLRVLESSGNEHFDAIMVRYIRETWVFTPAVKNGRRVRCIVQQTTRIVWEAGSPFGN
jgi:TonB family protein